MKADSLMESKRGRGETLFFQVPPLSKYPCNPVT